MKVEFTEHALERVEARVPHMGLKAIACEIDAAIAEGRVSTEPPSWRVGYPQFQSGSEFCWPPRRERIYVLGSRRTNYVVLVTVLRGARVAA